MKSLFLIEKPNTQQMRRLNNQILNEIKINSKHSLLSSNVFQGAN